MKRRKSRPRQKPAPAKRKVTARRRKSPAPRPPQPDPLGAMAAASAKTLGISVDPAWQKDVVFNMRLIMRHAARIDEFSLPDEAEPAPVFRA